MVLVDRPEQRQDVVLVPGRDQAHALGDGFGAAMGDKDPAHTRAESVVGERFLGPLGHLAQDADEDSSRRRCSTRNASRAAA